MNRTDLERLSREELIERVLRLQRPDKTSRNASKPPSSDRKARRENAKSGGAEPGHEGRFRALHDPPDGVEDHAPARCAQCGAPGEIVGESEEIALHRACCGAATAAELPAPRRGRRSARASTRTAVTLKTTQLFSCERLRAAFSDLLGLSLSEGASRIEFERTRAVFAALRKASFVSCDESGARIEGVNAYQWVFRAKEAVVHVPDFSRAAEVVRATMRDNRPALWISDRYSAQQGHGARQQTCLAHLERKARFADENSADDAPLRLRLWFGRVFALARNIESYTASTLREKRRALERERERGRDPIRAERMFVDARSSGRARDHLPTFRDFPGEVTATNTISESRLRPSRIQRKGPAGSARSVNGYRAEWQGDQPQGEILKRQHWRRVWRKSELMAAFSRFRLIGGFVGSRSSMLSAAWRRKARFCALASLRVRHSSSRNATSSVQCRLFSIAQCLRTALDSGAGSGGRDEVK